MTFSLFATSSFCNFLIFVVIPIQMQDCNFHQSNKNKVLNYVNKRNLERYSAFLYFS